MICSLLLAPACAGRGNEPVPAIRPCPGPAAPVFLALNSGEYIAGPGNLPKLLKNVSALRGYAEGLEITVNCYERQGVL